MFTEAELLAGWERVRDNNGCAGVDAVTVERFGTSPHTRLKRLQQALDHGEYRPLPLLEIVIEKAPGKTRRLLVPTVNDRIVQTAAARQLSHNFEDEFLDVSYAYRPGRGVDQAIARVLQLRDRGYHFVLDADVTAYFDNVDHALLLGLLRQEQLAPAMLALLESWLGVPVWDGIVLKKLGKGVPQGSPVSPVLANLFLHELDVLISASDQHIVRYADDFLVLCDSMASAEQAREVTAGWLLARRLELHPEKTAIRTFHEGFRFLGVTFAEDEAMVPWKGKQPTGRVVRVARPMPASLLNPFLRPRRKPGVLGAELSEAMAGLVLPKKTGGGGTVAFLYLTEQGSVLRKSGDRFLVEFDGRILLDLPYHKLEAVLVLGNVQITTQALGELMDKGILVSYLTRQGRFRGSVHAPAARDVKLRLAQMRGCDGLVALEAARAVIRAKVQNGHAVLRGYGGAGDVVHGIAEAPDHATLLGMEGSAAKAYFTAVMQFNKSEFAWKGRERQPPKDPVNALLSLTYTLLMTELTGLLEAHGLDAYLGFLHQPDFGRPSLALDILEPFRHPVADRFVLTLLNKRILQADDFVGLGGATAVRLLPESLKRYLGHWEGWMTAEPSGGDLPAKSYRREMQRQVETLVRHWRGEAEWEPWIWDGRQSGEEDACDSLSVTT